jgi:hypothetical protein
LRELFALKYDRELIGKEQGMFHSDFESDFGEVECAQRSIFLGKKFYIDELKVKYSRADHLKKWIDAKNDPIDFVEQTPDENGYVIDYHARAKGLSTDCLEFKAKELGITMIQLY